MPAWLDKLQMESELAAARCKGIARRQPRIAFCIAGAARGFNVRIVQEVLRFYVVQMLAPSGAAGGSRLFLQLKAFDSDKLDGWGDFGIHFDRHEAPMPRLEALINADGWLQRLMAEVSLVNGSGAFLGVGRRPGIEIHSTALRPADDNVWQTFTSPACAVPWGTRASAPWGERHKRYATTSVSNGRTRQSPARKMNVSSASNAQERLILSALGSAWCGKAIDRYESRAGQRFDYVAFARPDLLLRKAMPPWCELQTDTAVVCGGSGADGLWIIPRQQVGPVLNRAVLHSNCNGTSNMRLRKVGRDRGGGVVAKASCCGGAEALLASALLGIPGLPETRIDPRSCTKLGWPGELFLRQVQREPPTVPCMQRRHRERGECLHRHRHACDAALNIRYVPGGLWSRLQAYHNGLTLPTALLLRKLFQEPNQSTTSTGRAECYNALQQVDI